MESGEKESRPCVRAMKQRPGYPIPSSNTHLLSPRGENMRKHGSDLFHSLLDTADSHILALVPSVAAGSWGLGEEVNYKQKWNYFRRRGPIRSGRKLVKWPVSLALSLCWKGGEMVGRIFFFYSNKKKEQTNNFVLITQVIWNFTPNMYKNWPLVTTYQGLFLSFSFLCTLLSTRVLRALSDSRRWNGFTSSSPLLPFGISVLLVVVEVSSFRHITFAGSGLWF